MIDLSEIKKKQDVMSLAQKQGIEQFMRDVEEHIQKIASVWVELSHERKSELLAHSPILDWAIRISEGVKM